MSMTSDIATMRINRDLNVSELELDQAIVSSATLLATMIHARLETQSPVSVGQVAVMRLVRSLGALSEARSDLIRTHAELLKVGQERGALMDGDCPPPSGELEVQGPSLKVA